MDSLDRAVIVNPMYAGKISPPKLTGYPIELFISDHQLNVGMGFKWYVQTQQAYLESTIIVMRKNLAARRKVRQPNATFGTRQFIQNLP